jgi:outer membrane protein assembly factor BamB
MKPKMLLAVLILALCALSAGADDWPGFRGPNTAGISTEKGLPTRWSDTENLVWKTDMPGHGSSSPVVVGDKVFVTCYTGYAQDTRNPGNPANLVRHLLCVDRKTGTVLWNTPAKAKLPEQPFAGQINLHGYASSTPATDGERIYVFHGKSGVFAYDCDGKELWQTSVGERLNGWGSATSPLLYKELVIVNASVESNALVALDRKTGKEQWRAGGVGRSWGSPALVEVPGGKTELVMNTPNTVRGYDPDTGKELWTCDGIQDGYICTTVVSKDGIVYAIGANRVKNAVAIKAGGAGNVTRTNLLWNKGVGGNVPSPILYDDHLYWVNDGGLAYCLRAKDGQQVYAERLRGGAYASATAADGKLYVPTQKNGTFVLALGPKFQQLAHNTLTDDSTFNGSPTVSQGQIFIRSDKRLYCIGSK